MKLIQANPKPDNEKSIFTALNSKERSLRGKGTSFFKGNRNKWKHVKFYGWVTVTKAPGDILFAKVQSKSEGDEQKIFEAFIGYLTRHCGEYIDTLTIYYR
ncbi:MAG: hypothetical protein DYG99_01435 [Bacteroidetes bacterium CHB5]|jgi:hypothetical protein|nr:hypothetical protein [Bacteroidetes bacterium CHB5]